MPKTGAEMTRESMARRRQRAREAGLCYTCCKEKAKAGLTTCVSCNTTALERQKRKRERNREAVNLRQVIVAHEHAGDVAREHHLYENAAEHYQHALDIPAVTHSDRGRIAEKLIHTLFLTNNPERANALYNEVLAPYIDTPEQADKAVELLLQMARQMWSDSKTRESLPVIQHAIEIAETTGDIHLKKVANLKMTNHLIILSRYDDAAESLQKIRSVDHEDAELAINYYRDKSFLATVFGKTQEAYEDCERFINFIQESGDPYEAWGRGDIMQLRQEH